MITVALLLAAGWDVCGQDIRHKIEQREARFGGSAMILQSPKCLCISKPQMQRRPAGEFPALHWLTHAKQEPAPETK
jgi:hypothetical protein